MKRILLAILGVASPAAVYAAPSERPPNLIEDKDGKAVLFDLAKDIGEKNNLAESASAELNALDQKRLAWNAQLIPPAFEGLPWKKKDSSK